MDEHELRAWVHEQLRQEVPDSIWTLVRDDGYLNVLDDRERDDLLRRVARLLQTFSSQTTRKRRRKVTRSGEAQLKPVLSKYESQRSQALSEYYAKVAAAKSEVRTFRENVLHGRLLAKDEVLPLFDSHAARMLPPEEFEQRQIPLGHESSVITEEYVRGKKYDARLAVTPPGIEAEFKYRITAGDTFWEGVPGNHALTVRIDGHVHETAVFNGSLLDHLRLAGQVLEAFPWRPGDATWFILTGETPPFSPMLSKVSLKWTSFANNGLIELKIQPWVSATSVAAMYRRAQRQFLGRHNRPISERRLELFRFVNAAADDNLVFPRWRELMEAWNKRYRRWPYTNVRNFSRDYVSVSRSLAFPDYDELFRATGVLR